MSSADCFLRQAMEQELRRALLMTVAVLAVAMIYEPEAFRFCYLLPIILPIGLLWWFPRSVPDFYPLPFLIYLGVITAALVVRKRFYFFYLYAILILLVVLGFVGCNEQSLDVVEKQNITLEARYSDS
jgi:hypothetical protein